MEKLTWNSFFIKEYKKKYFNDLLKKLKEEYSNFVCFPRKEDIFSSFKYCSLKKLKVVILGQDPYYNKNQADGLCFSVQNGTKIPPSLRNIFIEVNNCFNNKETPSNGSLVHWAIQGILLLNSILTVREGFPKSHKEIGWEVFTNRIIHFISENKKNVVFLLWGKHAKMKKKFINQLNDHYVLETSHPSPFSAYHGFFGSKHFIKTNIFLYEKGKCPIKW